MPELYSDENVDWDTYYRSYVDTYLQRDIRDVAQVADEMQFFGFMTIVAAHTSKFVVYEELTNDLLPVDEKLVCTGLVKFNHRRNFHLLLPASKRCVLPLRHHTDHTLADSV